MAVSADCRTNNLLFFVHLRLLCLSLQLLFAVNLGLARIFFSLLGQLLVVFLLLLESRVITSSYANERTFEPNKLLDSRVASENRVNQLNHAGVFSLLLLLSLSLILANHPTLLVTTGSLRRIYVQLRSEFETIHSFC